MKQLLENLKETIVGLQLFIKMLLISSIHLGKWCLGSPRGRNSVFNVLVFLIHILKSSIYRHVWPRKTTYFHLWEAVKRNSVANSVSASSNGCHQLMVAALNYSYVSIIMCKVLPVKIRLLYRLSPIPWLHVSDSILEIKLLTCFLHRDRWDTIYSASRVDVCVCARACVVAFWVQTSQSCVKLKTLGASKLMILATYQVFPPPPHINRNILHHDLFTWTSLLILNVIEIYQLR